ncbi:MAG: hypothetical protein PHE33_03005 [Bacteroidales bacterium]|nr:hypothetical protein [Bacteroidales bacterium]
MKKNFLLLGLIAVIALFSCNGSKSDKNENKEEKQTICDVENAIAVNVQDYYYSMSDTLVYSTPDFQIVNSDYKWINDSTISLKLSNYDPKTIVGVRTEEQMDLNIEINARKGEKLEPGYYGYHDYASGKWSRVTLATAYGTVWFNWVDGIPRPGGVTIEYIGEDAICGTLELNNEAPENDMIGIVRINGTFVHKK